MLEICGFRKHGVLGAKAEPLLKFEGLGNASKRRPDNCENGGPRVFGLWGQELRAQLWSAYTGLVSYGGGAAGRRLWGDDSEPLVILPPA